MFPLPQRPLDSLRRWAFEPGPEDGIPLGKALLLWLLAVALTAFVFSLYGYGWIWNRWSPQERYRAEEERWRWAAEQNPLDASAWFNLGYAQLQGGRPAEAESSFRRAAELSPQDPSISYFLGSALMEQGKREEAESHLRQAAEAFPQNPLPRYRLAELYLQAGRFDDALEEASYILDHIDSTLADAYLLRCRAEKALGRREEAAGSCRRALSLDPSLEEAGRLFEELSR